MSKIGKIYKGSQLQRLASFLGSAPRLYRSKTLLIEVLAVGDFEFRHVLDRGKYKLISNPKLKKENSLKAEEELKNEEKKYKSIFISSFEDKNKPGYYDRKLK